MDLKERIQALCKSAGKSMNQVENDLGFGKGYISKLGKSTPNATKIKLIADYFNVSVDYLMNGKDSAENELSARNERDIEKALKETLEQLDSQDGLMFDGEALDDNTKELLKISLENTIRTAKIAAKKKFTPKSLQNGDD